MVFKDATCLSNGLMIQRKARSREVVKKRPDIKITVFVLGNIYMNRLLTALQTRHNYDIAHPYEWSTYKIRY